MRCHPSKRFFIEHAKAGILYPIYVEAPYLDPLEAFQRVVKPNSFFFDSLKGTENIARYSFMGVNPFQKATIKDHAVALTRDEQTTVFAAPPLQAIKTFLNDYKAVSHPELPPFPGGVACALNYDFVKYIEKIPVKTHNDLLLPDACLLFFDTVCAFDHLKKKAWIQSCPGAREIYANRLRWSDRDWGVCYDEAERNTLTLRQSILKPNKNLFRTSARKNVDILYEMDKTTYMNMVDRAKDYIKAGDIFQANLSQRLSADIGKTNPFEIYQVLREINPSPFAAFMDLEDFFIVSSSPERLIRMRNGIVDTRPIAGTRPRGINHDGDSAMRAELLLNEKERAEHIMLVDLERNDLGRISQYGSVAVNELMITEDYSHVIHIVSNVQGVVENGKDCVDVIKAVFPGGTITGAPKVRCMEIIDELEPIARGPYTGSLGYISFTGDMDLNIIIRTFVIKNSIAYVQAGAGIVADSIPEKEYYESLKKAEALIKTLAKLMR
jgi:anthranilate/para-aminobenzoate synthase component I